MLLVLGSSNIVGHSLGHMLVQAGASVRMAWHSREPNVKGVEKVRVDATTGEGLDAALNGVTRMFLLTGGISDQSSAEARLIEAAKRASVDRIVYLSILGAASEAFPFARIHRATEKVLESSGLGWVILRPGGFMQNFTTHYVEGIRLGDEFSLPCGAAKEAHIDGRDVARVATVAMLEDNLLWRTIDLTGPEALNYDEVARLISVAAHRQIRYRSISEGDFQQMIAGFGAPPQYADDLIAMFRYHASLATPLLSDAYRKIVGRPPTTFAEFAKEHAHFWQG